MAEKTFYHSSVGVWVAIDEPNSAVLASYPAGTVEIPSAPSVMHTWDGSSWVAPSVDAVRARQAEIARARRDDMLRYQVDPVASNALRWASLSENEQQQILVYRQTLLDITSQSGFPQHIRWPERPASLPEVKIEWNENIL